jgi:hypothetical protein
MFRKCVFAVAMISASVALSIPLSSACHSSQRFATDYSAIRQPALLSGSASLDGDSIGLHATTAATVPIAVGTATIASPSNPVVATDQRWSAILRYDLAVPTRPFVVAHVEDGWHNLARI